MNNEETEKPETKSLYNLSQWKIKVTEKNTYFHILYTYSHALLLSQVTAATLSNTSVELPKWLFSIWILKVSRKKLHSRNLSVKQLFVGEFEH